MEDIEVGMMVTVIDSKPRPNGAVDMSYRGQVLEVLAIDGKYVAVKTSFGTTSLDTTYFVLGQLSSEYVEAMKGD